MGVGDRRMSRRWGYGGGAGGGAGGGWGGRGGRIQPVAPSAPASSAAPAQTTVNDTTQVARELAAAKTVNSAAAVQSTLPSITPSPSAEKIPAAPSTPISSLSGSISTGIASAKLSDVPPPAVSTTIPVRNAAAATSAPTKAIYSASVPSSVSNVSSSSQLSHSVIASTLASTSKLSSSSSSLVPTSTSKSRSTSPAESVTSSTSTTSSSAASAILQKGDATDSMTIPTLQPSVPTLSQSSTIFPTSGHVSVGKAFSSHSQLGTESSLGTSEGIVPEQTGYTPMDQNTSSVSLGPSKSTTAGITVGVILLLVLLAGGPLFWRYKKRRACRKGRLSLSSTDSHSTFGGEVKDIQQSAAMAVAAEQQQDVEKPTGYTPPDQYYYGAESQYGTAVTSPEHLHGFATDSNIISSHFSTSSQGQSDDNGVLSQYWVNDSATREERIHSPLPMSPGNSEDDRTGSILAYTHSPHRALATGHLAQVADRRFDSRIASSTPSFPTTPVSASNWVDPNSAAFYAAPQPQSARVVRFASGVESMPSVYY